MVRDPKLLVIGDAMIDISVALPESKPGGAYPAEIRVCSGGLGNVAVAAAGSGIEVSFSGAVGKDIFGKKYEADLNEYGVDTYLKKCDLPTGMCLNLVSRDGNRTMYTRRGANDALRAKDIPHDILGSCQMLFISGFSLENDASSEQIKEIVSEARRLKTRIVLGGGSPNIIQEKNREFWSLAKRADVLIFNEEEARAMLQERDMEILSDLERIVIVTKGPEGSTAYTHEGEIHSPGYPCKVVDTTGAGDAFAGSLMAGLLRKRPLTQILAEANKIAAKTVTSLGPRSGEGERSH